MKALVALFGILSLFFSLNLSVFANNSHTDQVTAPGPKEEVKEQNKGGDDGDDDDDKDDDPKPDGEKKPKGQGHNE